MAANIRRRKRCSRCGVDFTGTKSTPRCNACQKSMRKERNAAIVADVKSAGCADCGERDPVVLEFHHRTKPEKRHHRVANLVPSATETRLRAEIEKCDVLCANCHLRRHHRERLEAKNAV